MKALQQTTTTSKTLLLGAQHFFAMFGATVLVPTLTGLSVSSTLFFTGIATLFCHFVTKWKVPVFLGSSFAFLGGYFAIAPNGDKLLLPYACFGVACAGILYVLMSILCKLYGSTKIMRYFPPVVTGPIIISIGLTLSATAIQSCSANWIVALVAIVTVIVCNIYGKAMIKIVPILIGVVTSYAVAVLLNEVDFTPVMNASWISLPFEYKDTVFSLFTSNNLNTGLLFTSAITIIPIAFATIMEHIGDISAISSTVSKNFIKDPGLHRTLIGDGIGTTIAALFGAPANTTYGENTGVLALTKVYDPKVIRLAAIYAILMSFCPKFSALISVMPTATVGGVSLILYGMISSIGVRNVVENKVDFSKSRNIIIAAIILVLSIGIKYGLPTESINIELFGFTIALSGLAVSSLVGIILNVILPHEDTSFTDEPKDSLSLGKY